jgi:hypothetical protein
MITVAIGKNDQTTLAPHVEEPILPSFVEDFGSELPQRVTVTKIEALVAEALHRTEVVDVNLLVVLIGKRDSGPGATTPLVDAALYLLAFEQSAIGIARRPSTNVLPLQASALWLRTAWD